MFLTTAECQPIAHELPMHRSIAAKDGYQSIVSCPPWVSAAVGISRSPVVQAGINRACTAGLAQLLAH